MLGNNLSKAFNLTEVIIEHSTFLKTKETGVIFILETVQKISIYLVY